MTTLRHKCFVWMLMASAVGGALVSHAAEAQTVGATSNSAQPASLAVAQQSGATTASTSEPQADAVSEIVVTAQKRIQNLNDVPLSVTAISGQDLKERGINSIADLVKVTPGLSFVETGRDTPVYSLRGVGFSDTSIGARPTVSIYNDEAPIPFSIEAAGSILDLERVEILKGPQGTLFGQNSTGGAINYIAAKPTGTFHDGAIVSYGRFNTVDAQGFVSGPITSTLDGRIALRGVTSDGDQESYARQAHLGAQRLGEGRILLDWRPVDKLKVSLNLNGYYDGSDTQASQHVAVATQAPALQPLFPLFNNYPIAPRDDRAADFNAGEKYRNSNSFFQSNVRADYELSKALTLTSLTSYAHQNVHELVDVDGTSLSVFDALDMGNISNISEEVRASGDLPRLHYLVGANFAHDLTYEQDDTSFPYSTTIYSVSRPPAPLITGTGSTTKQDFNTTAMFANADYDATKRIAVHGGVRFTQADLNWYGCTTTLGAGSTAAYQNFLNRLRPAFGLAPLSLTPGDCVTLDARLNTGAATGRLDQNNISWHAGLDFRPAPHTLLYVSVSKGYKAGSIETATATEDNQYVPATQESVMAYEGGFKAALLARTLELTGAGFYYDYTDKQVLGRGVFPPFGTLAELVNIPKSSITGGEAQATYTGVRHFALTLAATYLASDVTSDFLNYTLVGNIANFKGNAFPFTPKWQVVFDGEYKYPIADRGNVFAGANVSYRSQTTAGFGVEPLLAIDAYTLLDVRFGYETPDARYRVQVYGRNVLNTYYWTNVSRAGDSLSRLAGQPPAFGIQFSARN